MNMEEYWVHASMQLVVSLTASREPRGFGFVQYVEPAHAAEAKYQMDKSMTNVSLFDSHDQSARLMELHVLDALYSVSREPKAPYAVSNGLNASVSVHHGPSVLSDCHKFNEFLSDSHEPKASFSVSHVAKDLFPVSQQNLVCRHKQQICTIAEWRRLIKAWFI